MAKGDSLMILTTLVSETSKILGKDALQLLKMDMDGLSAQGGGEADAAEEDEADYNEDYDAGPGEYDDFF
jgi:hypothetical protein